MVPTERMQAEARKADILRAALPLFAMKGFAATTTKDLARAAGVSEGLLYKHFPSKESMYQELGKVFTEQSSGVSVELAKVAPSTASLVQVLYYLTRMVLKGPCGGEAEHDYLLRMMSRSLLEDGLFAKAFLESAFLPFVEPMEAFFAAARKEGGLCTEPRSDRFAIFYAHHLIVGVRLHALQGEPRLDGAGDGEARFRELVLFNLRGAGLKEAALRKHLDFRRLDKWFSQAFNLEPSPGKPEK